MFRSTFVLSLLLTSLTSSVRSTNAVASDDLRSNLRQVAVAVETIMKQRNATVLSVGSMQGPATFPTSSGPAIARILTEELVSLKLVVSRRASYGLKGSYSISSVPVPSVRDPDESDNYFSIKIIVEMVDDQDNPIDAFRTAYQQDAFESRDEETLVKLVGITGSIQPDAPPLKRNEQIKKQFESHDNAGDIRGNAVFVDEASKLGVAILVNNEAQRIVHEDGLPFVQLNQGDQYSVRILNQSNREIAAAVFIDGLSSFQFADARNENGAPTFRHSLIPTGKSYDINGWYRNERSVEGFLVTTSEQGVAAELQQTDKIGTITVNFHAAWPQDLPPPADEPGAAKSLGTTRGKLFHEDSEVVKRHVGILRGSISIRYDR